MSRILSGRRALLACLVLVSLLVLVAAAAAPGHNQALRKAAAKPTLTISAIPDQDPQILGRLYGLVSTYLSTKLHVPVSYKPMTDYTAAVTGFKVGDLQLVWFGGLTGVQARLQVPGSLPLAQRDIDEAFHSVVIANKSSGLQPVSSLGGLLELKGHTFTFGSQSSTSGYVMPEYFLHRGGVRDSDFKGQPGYSGSHDATLALVTAGSYDAGVMNAQVWQSRLDAGKVDTSKVQVIFTTPAFHDYHWLARPELDKTFGRGFTKRLRAVLLGIKGGTAAQRAILAAFGAKAFVPTTASNYTQIEEVGRDLGLIR
jgi:phosphonate transport system substrate-binding protein